MGTRKRINDISVSG